MINYHKPRLKPQVEFCSIGNKINFFLHPGVAIQLEDNTNFISNVCKIMNGIRTIDEIFHELSFSFPNEVRYLDDLLTVLDREFLLEDTHNKITSLSDYDLERWSRNIEFFGSYTHAADNKYLLQEKLKSIKVVVLGLGGVGSNVLYNLVAMGVENIKALDFDTIELSNLNRQILYNESDIGQLKSDVAKERIKKFLPNSSIIFINKQINCSEDIKEIINGYDIVINAIDYPREKIIDWLNLACVKEKIPFICGSLDSKIVSYFTIVPGTTGCVECWKSNMSLSKSLFHTYIQHENFVSSLSSNVAMMPYISLCSGFIASEFLKIVTSFAKPQSTGNLCSFDISNSEISVTEQWVKIPACLVCSEN